ncbi:MAG: hypothetical protein ACRDD7_00325 [Peptostreptococcaceae bacterium]
MSSVNDNKILKLKEEIKKKKEEISKTKTLKYVTNGVITVDGEVYNLNVKPTNDLLLLLSKLAAYKNSIVEFDLGELIVGGYTISEWIEDIVARIKFNKVKEEETKLKSMEQLLDRRLSEEKKIEIELDEIANMLK